MGKRRRNMWDAWIGLQRITGQNVLKGCNARLNHYFHILVDVSNVKMYQMVVNKFVTNNYATNVAYKLTYTY